MTSPHAVVCASCGRETRQPVAGTCGVCANGGFLPSESRELRVLGPDTLKRCLRCHEQKPLDEFDEDMRRRDWRVSDCRECRQRYAAAYRTQRRSRQEAR